MNWKKLFALLADIRADVAAIRSAVERYDGAPDADMTAGLNSILSYDGRGERKA